MAGKVLWRKPSHWHAINSLRWRSTSATAAVKGGGRRFEDMPTERGSSWLFGVGPELFNTPQDVFLGRMKEKHGKVFRLKIGVGKYLVIVADVVGAETVIRNEGKYPSRGVQLEGISLVLELSRKRMGLTDTAIIAA